jgi:hypothetical protein
MPDKIDESEAIATMFDDELDRYIQELDRLRDLAGRERVTRRLREKKRDQRTKDQ